MPLPTSMTGKYFSGNTDPVSYPLDGKDAWISGIKDEMTHYTIDNFKTSDGSIDYQFDNFEDVGVVDAYGNIQMVPSPIRKVKGEDIKYSLSYDVETTETGMIKIYATITFTNSKTGQVVGTFYNDSELERRIKNRPK